MKAKALKAYIVTYGNDAWKDEIKVYARNKTEAIQDTQSELRSGVRIIKIIEL